MILYNMANRNITIPISTATPGAKSSATKFLDSDYIPDISTTYGQLVTVHIALTIASAPSIIRYSKDGGTTWINFLNGEQLTAGSGLERQILLRYGDSLNFSAADNIILAFCELDLV